ncbi:hypothetical protein [Novosphingobium sp.]|jgi:hypothetical protein|uniref:hypothetical protein n=1 Tax=Novosphingobium sp. TaxID=1874826 RepID=UPI002FE2B9C5
MTTFVDTRDWPLARLVMPEHVADAEAEGHIAQLVALYDRQERFVLLLAGAELPRHSPAFMKAYAQWSMSTLELARRYCLGAVRVEPDAAQREAYRHRAEQAAKAGAHAYPYEIVADAQAADDLARRWLGAGEAATAERS